jgi:hypothetical protein
MPRYEQKVKLEQKCIERNWTPVVFKRVFADQIFDRLMESLNDKYCIIPSFDRGYDDSLTSKIYFQNSNDAWSFQVLIKDLLLPPVPKANTIGYFQFIEDEYGFGSFVIIDKAFWDENEHLNGDGLSEEAEEALDDHFYALAECYYEHDFETHEDAKQALIDAGFEEKQL